MSHDRDDPVSREERFEALFRENSATVLAFATHHVGPVDAEDVTAEVFAIAWRRFDRLPDPARPWLLVTARNTIANRRRKLQRHAHFALDEAFPIPSTAVSDGSIEDHDEVMTALRQLQPQDREVLVLKAWYDLTDAQAAKVLGCRTGTFSVRLHRARRALRQVLIDTAASPRPANLPE